MKNGIFIFLGVCALLGGPLHAQNAGTMFDGYSLSGPFTHQNLSIYLFSGKDAMPDKEIFTLEEALDRKILVVHETGDVNRLKVTNKSRTAFVFIMAGDIVKGGKQDRTLQHSLLVEPLSKEVPVNAFCVEQGRWHPRSSETAAQFSTSKDSLVSKQLKIAARGAKSQQEVWNEVANTRGKLRNQKRSAHDSAGPAAAPASPSPNQNAVAQAADRGQTSLQLAVEDKEIQAEIQKYCDALIRKPDAVSHVVGYAFAVNGRINSADFFVSSRLFAKLWPKLLRASALEAFAERETPGKTYAKVSAPEIATWLKDAEQGKQSVEAVDAANDSVVTESESNLKYEVRAKGQNNRWIHKNVIKK